MNTKNKQVDLSMNWQTAMKYLLVLIQSHANKSFLEQDSDGVSPRDTVRELLQDCAWVADLYVNIYAPPNHIKDVSESEVK